MKYWPIAAGLVAIGFLVVVAAVLTIQAAFTLVFGWAPFIGRVLPQMTVDGPTVAVGAAATVLFAAVFHRVARTFRGIALAAPESAKRPWRIRSTIMVVSAVFLLFAAGISLIGVVHQLAWLADSDKPLLAEGLARRSNSAHNLGDIVLGMHNYASASASSVQMPAGGTFAPDGSMLHSWETLLLNYTSYSSGGIDKNRPWNDPVNQPYFRDVIPGFINDSLGTPPLEDEDKYGLSHYSANIRVMGPNRAMELTEITDGLANTILIGEVNAGFKPWGHPVNWRDPAIGINRGPNGFGGPRGAGGALFGMADGSVRFISDKIDPAALRALSAPCAGD